MFQNCAKLKEIFFYNNIINTENEGLQELEDNNDSKTEYYEDNNDDNNNFSNKKNLRNEDAYQNYSIIEKTESDSKMLIF